MSYDLVPKGHDQPMLANFNQQLAKRLAHCTTKQDVDDIFRAAARQLTGEQLQLLKAVAAVGFTSQLYAYTFRTADVLKRQAYQQLAAPGRSEACQADVEHLYERLMATYDTHLLANLEIAVRTLARELDKEVVLPQEKKRTFWTWLFGEK